MGPAVDEAAALYERVEAAVVELTSSAAEHPPRLRTLPGTPSELTCGRLTLEYDVP